MYKFKIVPVLLYFVTLPLNAHAQIFIGMELPVRKAEIIEHDANGNEIDADLNKELVEFRKPGSLFASSFQLIQKDFVVVSAQVEPNCGDINYIAITRKRLNTHLATSETLEVTDHSKNTCEKYNNEWEARLIPPGNSNDDLLFEGNPEPVNTIQKGCDSISG